MMHPLIELTTMRPIEEAWSRCCQRLRTELGEDVFSSWFPSLRLEEVVAGQAMFSISTRFLKSWVEAHYQEKILAALNVELSGVSALQISVRSPGGSDGRAPSGARTANPGPAAGRTGTRRAAATPSAEPPARRPPFKADGRGLFEALAGSPLDRRLNFAHFLVGRANQLAFNAAERVIEARVGEPPAFSPLYIHASVGLGKTHLLQAIAHAAIDQGRSAVYLTAEKFMYGFVAALQSQTAMAFKEAMRSIDLLIFDDAQFLQGKVIQAEFGHALNALVDAGRQVVVAADRPPGDLELLDERVRSRLAGGLCVEMLALDEPLRIKILEARILAARAQNPHFEVSPQVLAFVARSIVSNGRDLEGAVNRLIAHTLVGAPPLSVERRRSRARSHPRPRAQKGQDRGHPEAGGEPLQRHARRYSFVAAHRDGGETAPGRHVSLQGADPALAAGNRPPFRRTRSYDRSSRRPQDRRFMRVQRHRCAKSSSCSSACCRIRGRMRSSTRSSA